MVGPEITRRLPYYEGMRLSACHYLGIGTALGASLLYNYVNRRPFSASLLRHLASLAGGYIGGGQVAKFMEDKRNQKASVIDDYICRHPEDFPLVKPKKYKDVLLPWTPIR